ncbi:hypothetical protein PSM7751_01639 [Pseudooceanicola marinus]|uniref:Uncharacterized protein n=1 Tax=Pseudooceanicola marinus TaxID=396013 RepID=A0A1X6Z1L7_9RHOB|nr:hypothetical protein [Pseudooceanicola marinus]PJE32464.1 hypothetical protein CVM50_06045 [Pseudooceanicola marinus]SLN37276.1 hypothetical protein PSM7751_01639 [Pseudooceanicola marinus]
MTQSFREFDDRVRRIENKSRRAGGMRFTVDDYGNVRRRGARRFGLWRLTRGLLVLVAAIYLFKVIGFSFLGAAEFERRAEVLSEGAGWERTLSRLMQVDPLTQELGTRLRPYIKHL